MKENLMKRRVGLIEKGIALCTNKEDIIDRVIRKTKDRINSRRTTQILMSKVPTETIIDDYEQYWIIKSLYESVNELKDKNLTPTNIFNPENIFEKVAIIEYESRIPKNINNNNNILVFEGMRRKIPHDRTCTTYYGYVPYKTIANAIFDGLLTYNINTQRDPKVKLVLGKEVKLPNVNPESVESIIKSIESGNFEDNMITLNIFKSDYAEEKFDYNEDKERLAIEITDLTPVHIVDGGHRCYSIAEVIRRNPDFEGYILVKVVNYGIERAINVVKQEGTVNQIDKDYYNTLDSDNRAMLFTKEINAKQQQNNQINNLFNKIGLDKQVKIGTAYVSQTLFSEEINHYFSDVLESTIEQRKFMKYIIEFFNYVIDFNKELFENNKKSQKDFITTRENTFIGYITIAKELYGVDDWQDILLDILDKIDFNIKNEQWQELRLDINLTLNPRQKNRIREYFKEVTQEYTMKEGVM